MARFDTSTSSPRMPRYRPERAAKPDPADPTPEQLQRCAETWSRAKREIEAAVDATRMPRKGRHAPPPDYTPRFDIFDLPDANASWAEVKAWEERQREREGQHADGS